MTTAEPQVFHHPAFREGFIKVYPVVDEATGTLNPGLSTDHYHAQWDGLGAGKDDDVPTAGWFPTLESLAIRAVGDPSKPPRDGLLKVRSGMTTHVRAITLTPGKHVFRFGQRGDDPKSDGPFFGAWWTSSLGFENILARVSATYENSSIGVVQGRGMKLREYARRYSAVFTDWSRMDIVGVSMVMKPITCFMGMGAKLTRDDVEVKVDGIPRLATETYQDANVQLFIPNLFGRLGTHLTRPQTWTPERIDELLSRRVQQMRTHGALLSQRKQFIFQQLMTG